MSDGFSNPIIGGGGTLVYPSIHSPNFVHNLSGWTANKDGSAEFNNLEIRGSITSSVINGLSYVLNGDGLFIYSAPAPSVVQVNSSANGNITSASSPVTIPSAGMSATAQGNAVYFIVGYYRTGFADAGITSVVLNNSGAALNRIFSAPFNGSGPTAYNAWLEVWGISNIPGGDTGVKWTVGIGTGAGFVLSEGRHLIEVANLGVNPNVDVAFGEFLPSSTGSTFTTGSKTTVSSNELWLGAVAGYDNGSVTAPTITGPGAPWNEQTQQSTQVDSFTAAIGVQAAYQVAANTGTISYAGSFSAAQNWSALAIAIKPDVESLSSSSLVGSIAAKAGKDKFNNSYPANAMLAQIFGQQPNTDVQETWHSATLLNSWAGSGSGVNGLFYRMLPLGDGIVEIIADIQNATATGNSVCFTLPSGYQPSVSSNHPAAINNFNTAVSVPWINIATNGNVQITGIPSANHEIFFHIFVPLNLTA